MSYHAIVIGSTVGFIVFAATFQIYIEFYKWYTGRKIYYWADPLSHTFIPTISFVVGSLCALVLFGAMVWRMGELIFTF